jgi:phytoene dehydrogenase-like protein
LDVWDDPHRSAASVARISPSDVEGYLRYCDLFGRIRRALREGPRDTWIGEAPNRADLEELLGADAEAKEVLFEASIADVVERHVRDERLRTALHGQGIIGTFAGPRDAGTASIHLMHASGALEGKPGAWGYVEGGMGRVSVALASAALDAGAVIATDVEVAAIAAGEGVRLGGGEFVKAPVVVSNADPKTTAALFEGELPEAFSEKVRRWSSDGCVVKLNCGLARLPSFLAEVASGVMPHRAMVTVSSGIDATQSACEDARSGRPAPAWCELYFQTAYDASVAPAGRHQMSVFAQYVPYRLDGGGWDARREEIGDMVLAEIARFAPDVEDCVIWRQVLGPPDTEARIGLAGGHIFQGECLPGQMWERRFAPRTPVADLYLCGAATHPGGSVIAVNGRNAAMAVLADLRRRPPRLEK